MRLKKWKSFLCICTSCTLLMSTAASANPSAITPLEESQVSSFQSGNQTTDQGMVSSQGPGSESGSGGAVISSDGPS
ncbi:MAG: D-alanyl-D-alanine carboxypeptidase, partial [Clostridia bacterium]|nr:D-alanyl-D-alanine carboxypeptidase [Clostridia bacterium]